MFRQVCVWATACTRLDGCTVCFWVACCMNQKHGIMALGMGQTGTAGLAAEAGRAATLHERIARVIGSARMAAQRKVSACTQGGVAGAK